MRNKDVHRPKPAETFNQNKSKAMGREEKGEGNVDSIAMGRRRNKNKKLAVRKAPYNDRCHSHPLYGKLNRVMDKLGEDDGDDEEGEDELVRELSALLEEAPLPHRTAASHAGTSMEEVRNALETVRGELPPPLCPFL